MSSEIALEAKMGVGEPLLSLIGKKIGYSEFALAKVMIPCYVPWCIWRILSSIVRERQQLSGNGKPKKHFLIPTDK